MMRTFGLVALFAAAVAVTAAPTAAAQTYGKAPMPGEQGPDVPKNVAFDQKLGAVVPLDLEFTDHDGRSAPLREYFGGKPTILVLHYNRCPKLCNEVVTGLLSAMNEVRRSDSTFVAGGPFNVVFVSIDPREAPVTARKSRELFLKEYDGRNPDAPGVWFLTASQGQGTDVAGADRKIHQLADVIGFKYELRFRNRDYLYRADSATWATADGRHELPPEPRGYDYGHAAGVTFVTPDGTVSSYLLNLIYAPRDVRLALVDASGGKIGTLTDVVRQYCFTYDEVKGHYRLTMKLLGVAAVPFVLLVVVLTLRAVRQAAREPKLLPGQAFPDRPTATA